MNPLIAWIVASLTTVSTAVLAYLRWMHERRSDTKREILADADPRPAIEAQNAVIAMLTSQLATTVESGAAGWRRIKDLEGVLLTTMTELHETKAQLAQALTDLAILQARLVVLEDKA